MACPLAPPKPNEFIPIATFFPSGKGTQVVSGWSFSFSNGINFARQKKKKKKKKKNNCKKIKKNTKDTCVGCCKILGEREISSVLKHQQGFQN
jgi:hypothetical protein